MEAAGKLMPKFLSIIQAIQSESEDNYNKTMDKGIYPRFLKIDCRLQYRWKVPICYYSLDMCICLDSKYLAISAKMMPPPHS